MDGNLHPDSQFISRYTKVHFTSVDVTERLSPAREYTLIVNCLLPMREPDCRLRDMRMWDSRRPWGHSKIPSY